MPFFFGTTPTGEQCNGEYGGNRKGPVLCLRESSFFIASVIAAALVPSEERMFGTAETILPE